MPYQTHFILSLLGEADVTAEGHNDNSVFVAVPGDGRLGRVQDIVERPLVKDCYRPYAPTMPEGPYDSPLTALTYAHYHDLRCCTVWLKERLRGAGLLHGRSLLS